MRGEDRPDRNGFPVGQVLPAKPGLVLDGMGKGMTEVKFPALVFFEGVAGDDAGLD